MDEIFKDLLDTFCFGKSDQGKSRVCLDDPKKAETRHSLLFLVG